MTCRKRTLAGSVSTELAQALRGPAKSQCRSRKHHSCCIVSRLHCCVHGLLHVYIQIRIARMSPTFHFCDLRGFPLRYLSLAVYLVEMCKAYRSIFGISVARGCSTIPLELGRTFAQVTMFPCLCLHSRCFFDKRHSRDAYAFGFLP